jgi:hypothetical protein
LTEEAAIDFDRRGKGARQKKEEIARRRRAI